MKTEITLTAKETTKNGLNLIEVKREGERKIIAKIYPPNKYHPDSFQVEQSIAFYATTKEQALEIVRQKYENTYNTFEDKYSVKIIQI